MVDMGDRPVFEVLRDAAPTPIAQLDPEIPNPQPRLVDGVVTITWPYSIVTKSVAFILAEHDALIRRRRGQVRVEFHGASAKAFADAKIGGGDQLRISLDGSQWTKSDAKAALPAGSLDWQLTFTNRLLLSIRRDASQEPQVIHLDAPGDHVDGPLELPSVPRITPPPDFSGREEQEAAATPLARPSTVLSKRLASETFELDEYASPAFIKRARVSYGSLFEDGLDLFGDEGKKKKTSRRKSRFSMGNTVWRYSSRSPSPEPKEPSESSSPEAEEATNGTLHTTQQSAMVDEGCQTHDLEFSPSMHVQVSAEAHFPESSVNDATLYTPARNLFGHPQPHPHSHPQPEPHYHVSDVAAEPIGAHHHGFGLGLPATHLEMASNAFAAASGPEVLETSTLGSVRTAGVHPAAAVTEQYYTEPVLHHDSLHFHHQVHSPNHNHFFESQEGHPWQPEASSSYPPVPQPAVMMDSSPPDAETSLNRGPASPQAPLADEQASCGHESSAHEAENPPADEVEQGDSESDEDIKGEDYDLRNYAHTLDDDESGPDDESDAPGSDVDEQALDSGPDGDTSEEEDSAQVAPLRRGLPDREQEEFAGSGDEESIDEEQDYDEGEGEEGYDDEEVEEEYDEEEEYESDVPPAPRGPKEPEFISLLSDSEDEEDRAPSQVPQARVAVTHKEVEQDDVAETDEEAEQDEAAQAEEESEPEASEAEAAQDTEEPTDRLESEEEDAEMGGAAETMKGPEATQEPGETAKEPRELTNEPKESEAIAVAQAEDSLENEPVQPAADVEGAEQEEPDTMEVDEESPKQTDHVVAEEPEPKDVVETETQVAAEETEIQNVAETATPVIAQVEHDTQGPVATEVQKEEQTEVAADVEMTDSAAVDTREPAGEANEVAREANMTVKANEPVAKTEPEPAPEFTEPQKGEVANENEQLPTPAERQTLDKIPEPEPSKEDDDSAAAEDQIMNEYREYQSPSVKATDGVKPMDSVQPSTEAAEAPSSQHEPDVLITVRSLRSHCHPKTRSSGSTCSLPEDPSVLLAQASSPAEAEIPNSPEPTREANSPGLLRIARGTKTSHQPDPSILLARSSAEPTTGPTVRVTRSMTEHTDDHPSSPVGQRASKRLVTPDTHATTTQREDANTLKSPSVSGSVAEEESVSALQRQLQKDLRTHLPDYIPLRSLRTCLNKTTDILAVASSTPPQPHRPKHGPRDYMLELTLTDPSSSPSGISVAHVFRPHQASLPVVHRGDVVLLRRVTVVSMKGRGFGVRVGDASAWAVFELGDEDMLPQIKGPPVEVADEEVEYAGGLRKWWAVLDERVKARIDRATQKVLGA